MALIVFVGIARLIGGSNNNAMARAAILLLPAWFAVTGYNMWVGISQPGYGVTEEAPIFLLLFGLPAAAVLYVRQKLSRQRQSVTNGVRPIRQQLN